MYVYISSDVTLCHAVKAEHLYENLLGENGVGVRAALSPSIKPIEKTLIRQRGSSLMQNDPACLLSSEGKIGCNTSVHLQHEGNDAHFILLYT